MKRRHILLPFVSAVFANAALQAQVPEDHTSPLSPDSNFVEVATGNESGIIQMSEMATQKASAAMVKEFAKRIAVDHRRVSDDLTGIAKQEGVPVATSMNAKNKATYDVLSGLPDGQLDETYIRYMIRELSNDIVVFQKEAGGGKNPKISNFASSKLPVLKEHLKLARDTASKLGLTVETTEP